MPPSQLKQLKASLREHGVVGPQQSKKQKKRKDGRNADTEKKLARQAALEGIRERFNPFEVKAPARKTKFDVTTSRTLNGGTSKSMHGRPGVTKGLGEQRRKETLLGEIHRRNKVGGILDRRFGEDDPFLTPEQKAAERYARESERRLKKNSIFNLEDEDDGFGLTHGGQALFDEQIPKDDFNEEDLPASGDESSTDQNGDVPRKRRRILEDDDMGPADEQESNDEPERPKTKKEVMEEVIAKSKLHRYERQQAKEDDDALRAELDKGLPEFFELMRQQRRPAEPVQSSNGNMMAMNPEREALLLGKDRKTADAEYNERVRQMAMDQRSKPADRTKTEEERLEEEASRLRELEKQRLKRMQGEEDEESQEDVESLDHDQEEGPDDAGAFGLRQAEESISRPELDVEDEDEFMIDDDLVASDSEADLSLSEEEISAPEDDEDDEFLSGLRVHDVGPGSKGPNDSTSERQDLAFTYPCPATHSEFLEIVKSVPQQDVLLVVQRIRALYHPKLDAGNKSKLEKFCKVLVDHVVHVARQSGSPSASLLDGLLRHVHSLAKSFPLAVGLAFRDHLTNMGENRPLTLEPADLVLLTGVGHIFSTSDHFHSVVTPALLTIARYLAQSQIDSLSDVARGLYCCTLAVEYQQLSKHYIPEVMLYILNVMLHLAPVENKAAVSTIPYRAPTSSLRIRKAVSFDAEKLSFWEDVRSGEGGESLKARLLSTCLKLLERGADLWSDASAFTEIFGPACSILDHLLSKPCTRVMAPGLVQHTQTVFSHIQGLLLQAQIRRRPLTLHHHRPLAIKAAMPKFEEGFNPDRHYDPDRERAEVGKLKAEHKREKKGAMRELRKDANFMARESLREKKEKDAAYEKKHRRLIAEIQGEEGREAKEYDREKRKRQGKR